MDRDWLERPLERAEERIVLGEKQIAHQKEVIAKLERAGQGTVIPAPKPAKPEGMHRAEAQLLMELIDEYEAEQTTARAYDT